MSWIKMRTDLRDHPKVIRMASALKADRLRVIGGLHAVWSTFDAHSIDGTLEGYSLAALDDVIGWKGFGAALVSVKWLVELELGLQVPEFDEHNGSSAKRRATDAKRKASDREEDKSARGSWNQSGQMSASDADKKPPRVREEKEKEIPPTPKGEGRFPEFWEQWPASDRKQDRKKCLAKWQRNRWDDIADVIAAHVAAMKKSRSWLDGFEPAPLTYLNGERWKDGMPAERPSATSEAFAGML